MRTIAQIEASRTNGSRSHGPVTEQGKAISSRNATTHGIYATTDPSGQFQQLREELRRHLAPTDSFQDLLADRYVVAQYRLQKLFGLECALFSKLDQGLENPEEANPEQIVTQTLNSMAKLIRVVSATERTATKVLRELRESQAVNILTPKSIGEAERTQGTAKTFSQNEPEKPNTAAAPNSTTQKTLSEIKKLQNKPKNYEIAIPEEPRRPAQITQISPNSTNPQPSYPKIPVGQLLMNLAQSR
jgi:hypothetical protein